MAAIIIGSGVGCWMYAFVNHRYNKQPWVKSNLFFWLGLILIIIGICLIFV